MSKVRKIDVHISLSVYGNALAHFRIVYDSRCQIHTTFTSINFPPNSCETIALVHPKLFIVMVIRSITHGLPVYHWDLVIINFCIREPFCYCSLYDIAFKKIMALDFTLWEGTTQNCSGDLIGTFHKR